jgi:hypothetical protein
MEPASELSKILPRLIRYLATFQYINYTMTRTGSDCGLITVKVAQECVNFRFVRKYLNIILFGEPDSLKSLIHRLSKIGLCKVNV